MEYKDSDESSEAWLSHRVEAAEEYVREHADDDDLYSHNLLNL